MRGTCRFQQASPVPRVGLSLQTKSRLLFVPGTRIANTKSMTPQCGVNHVREGRLMGAVLLLVLIVLLAGTVPAYPHSRQWGYYPSGGIGLLLIIRLLLILMGNVPW